MAEYEDGVHTECPLKNAEGIREDVQRIHHISSQLVHNEIPDGITLPELAGNADKQCQEVSDACAIQRTKDGWSIRGYSNGQVWAANRRATFAALNPERNVLHTVGLSLEAVRESALLVRRSRLARAAKLTQSSISGGISIGVAATAPFNNLPGMAGLRRRATAAAQHISG